MLKLRCVDSGTEWLTVEQIARLIAVTRHARDRFLVLLLWGTCMRIGEALGLRREDMHFLALGLHHSGKYRIGNAAVPL